jgi:hypothetical protein
MLNLWTPNPNAFLLIRMEAFSFSKDETQKILILILGILPSTANALQEDYLCKRWISYFVQPALGYTVIFWK